MIQQKLISIKLRLYYIEQKHVANNNRSTSEDFRCHTHTSTVKVYICIGSRKYLSFLEMHWRCTNRMTGTGTTWPCTSATLAEGRLSGPRNPAAVLCIWRSPGLQAGPWNSKIVPCKYEVESASWLLKYCSPFFTVQNDLPLNCAVDKSSDLSL